MDGAPRVCVGVIVGAQGVRGAVRVKPFTADAAAVAAYGPVEDEAGKRRFDLRLVGQAKGVVIATLPGIGDRDAAEALKGVRLYVPRAALPPPEEEEWYHADLIGLETVLADGTPLGRIKAIHEFGAGDSLEIERPGAASVMVPFTKAAVPVVDPIGGRVVIEPPAGLFETPPAANEKERLDAEDAGFVAEDAEETAAPSAAGPAASAASQR